MSPYKKSSNSPGRSHRPSGSLDYKQDAPTPQESIRPDFLAGTTPIGSDEETAMENSAYSGAAEDIAKNQGLSSGQLETAETAGGAAAPTAAEQQESESPGLFKNDGKAKAKGRGRFSPRKKLIAGGGITGIIIALIFGVFSIVHGPLQIIHFAQLLTRFHHSKNELMGEGRTSSFLRNMRNKTPEKNHLGFVTGKLADRFEMRQQENVGLRSVYDDRTGRFVGYEIIDPVKAKESVAGFKDDGIPIEDKSPAGSHGAGPKGSDTTIKGPVVNMKDERFKTKRSSIRAANNGAGTSKLVGSIASRLLIIRGAVDFHPLKNIQRKAEDKLIDWYRARRKERAERDRNGTTSGDPSLKPYQEEDPNGKKKPPEGDQGEAIKEGQDAATEAQKAHGGDEEAIKVPTESNAKRLAKGGVTAIGFICIIRSMSEKAADLQYLNIVIPLMRIGMRITATGFQVMSGIGVNINELGSVVSDLYDAQTGLGWNSARSIQAELGQDPSGPDIESKPDFINNKPPIFKLIDTMFEKTASLGKAACSTAGQFLLSLVAGPGDAIRAFLQGEAKTLLGVPDPLQVAAEQGTRWLAGEAVNFFAKGAELGNNANWGARMAANDEAIAMGGRALSNAEVAELNQASNADRLYQFSQKSMLAKVFDVNDTDSVLAKATMSMPASPSQTLTALMRSPMSLFSSVSHLASKPAMAASTYDYGFPVFGFSLGEQNDPKYQDPFENASVVEPKLPELNKKYKDCFSMEVNPDTGDLKSGKATRYDKIKENANCNNGTEELTRYRFYLADRVTEYSLACYEGDDQSCKQVGFGVTVDTGGNTNTPASSKIEGDPYTDSSTVACAPGTKETGKGEGWVDGKSFPITLCELPNLPSSWPTDSGFAHVNSRVSGAWFTLINDAAAAGVNYSVTSSYRTMAEQESIWARNPDPSAVARPGYSSHQAGVALDIAAIDTYTGGQDCGSGRATEPGNKYWDWLHEHAESYGFKQYSAEAWHWDALPAANRCGSG